MIVIIDYGMGNLQSVSKALEALGGRVRVSSSAKEIEKATKLVLPGVGAFGDAVKELRSRRLFEPVQTLFKKGRPFLGICLGLQLLFESSQESPGIKGLGLCKGSVRRFRSKGIKIPHMGWNSMERRQEHPLLRGLKGSPYFYFVHSYYAVPKDPSLVTGITCYGRETFPATLGGETFFATQFHPEKSQAAGLTILKNFIRW